MINNPKETIGAETEPIIVPPWKLKPQSVYDKDSPDNLNKPKFFNKKWVLVTILLLLVTNSITAGYFIKQIQDAPGKSDIPVDTPETPNEVKPLIPGAPQSFLDISGPLAQTHDTQRRADLTVIATALVQLAVESGIPQDFPTSAMCIGKSDGCYDLGTKLVPVYLSEIPIDPTIGTDINSGYSFYVVGANNFVVEASGELEPVITIKR